MTLVYQDFFGRFALSTSLNDLALDGNPVTLTTGYYYTSGYTGEGSNQLCEHMQAQIQAEGGRYASTTVTYSLTTGFVTIDFQAGANVTIGWTDSGLQTLLGFTGTQSGATSYTGTQVPRYNWRPSVPITFHPGNSTVIFVPRSTTVGGRTNTGSTWGSVGNVLYDASITYETLTEAEVLKPASGTIGADLESFFEDVIHENQPIRMVLDTTSYAATTDYLEVKVQLPDGGDVGSFEDFRARTADNYQGLWDVTLPLVKYV